MKKSQFTAILLCLFLIQGCSDFLEKESSDEVIVKTVEDFSELLLGNGYPDPKASLFNILYVLDDDFMLDERALNNEEDYQGAISVFPFYSWQPDMWERQEADKSLYGENYTSTYERIMGTNAVLDGIDGAKGDQQARERVKAEALALRAYYYFMLVNLYGEPYNYRKEALGVPLKLTANMQLNGSPRNTVEEVYEQIVRDLTSSSLLLEKQNQQRGDFRINLPTVNILLSRVYLYMERWNEAITAATKAINSGHPLTNYVNLPAVPTCMANYNYSEVEWIYGNGNTPTRSLSGMVVSSDLREKFEANSNDTRKALWFQGTYWNITKKRLSFPNGTPRMPTNSIRISEAYLNRAEAYAQNKNAEEAWKDLSHLQAHRYRNYTETKISDPVPLLEAIRAERRLELCFDEIRWFDLRRYGMPALSHLYKTRTSSPWKKYELTPKDPMYTLPFPTEILNENSALQQNESAHSPARQETHL